MDLDLLRLSRAVEHVGKAHTDLYWVQVTRDPRMLAGIVKDLEVARDLVNETIAPFSKTEVTR